MDNEIKNIEDLKGKIISEVKLDCGDLWLKFSDNTFAVLVVNDITEGFGYPKHEVGIEKHGRNKTDSTLVELGLITQKEFTDACEQENLEYKKYEEERERKEQERIKKIELEQLEKLKSKYGL